MGPCADSMQVFRVDQELRVVHWSSKAAMLSQYSSSDVTADRLRVACSAL